MKFHMKNMVCKRCYISVKQILEHTGINNSKIQIGIVEVDESISKNQIKKIEKTRTKIN